MERAPAMEPAPAPAMQRFQATVEGRTPAGRNALALVLGGCEALQAAQPGQFVMVHLPGLRDPLLPRALSLLGVEPPDRIELLVKIVGRATRLLARCQPKDRLDVLGPRGRPFPPCRPDRLDFYVAGGCGLAPLYMQAVRARRLALAAGEQPQGELFLGGRSAADLLLRDRLGELGLVLHLATEDGTLGRQGMVTEALSARLAEGGFTVPPTVLACGPGPMLAEVARIAGQHGLPAFVSLEGEMACGSGVCLGCAVAVRGQPYCYVCQDGPVFPAEDVFGQ